MILRTALAAVLTMLPHLAHAGAVSPAEPIASVAVFPVENLSGVAVPVDAIRGYLMDRLAVQGLRVLPPEALDDFMTRRRVRYAAGVDGALAEWLRTDTGLDAVVIASVDLSSDGVPPKVGLTLRLVSLRGAPAVVWADDAGVSGDQAPGLFDLGVVHEHSRLLSRALGRITDTLLSFMATGARPAPKSASTFEPRSAYRDLDLADGRTYSVAVLPFFNVSDRRNAGEVLALLFMRHLASFDAFRVADPGDVRRQLLQARIIMEGGVSLTDADLVGSILDTDLVLGGRVLEYRDYDGADGVPRVEFSAVIIDRRTRRVVWSSQHANAGDDGVRFFGLGRSTTAHGMATQMVRRAAERLAQVRK